MNNAAPGGGASDRLDLGSYSASSAGLAFNMP